MSYTGRNPKFKSIKLEPLSADPVNPVEGQKFYSDGTTRDEGVWTYKNGDWIKESDTDDLDALDAVLTGHINDASDAHDASAVTNTPAGNLAATDVQGALNELQSDIDTLATGTDLTNHIADTTTHGTTGDIVGTSDAQTLTTKTIDADNNTISNLEVDNLKSGVLDTDLESVSASDDTIPSAKATKTYVDDSIATEPRSKDTYFLEDFYETTASDITLAGWTGNDTDFVGGGTLQGTLDDNTGLSITPPSTLRYVQAAGSLNDYVASIPILTRLKQRGNTTGVTLYYTYDGDPGDIKFVMRDLTGDQILSSVLDTFDAASNATRYTTSVEIPTGAVQIQWGFQVVVENIGATLEIDEIEFTTDPFVYKNLIEEQVYHASVNSSFNIGTVNKNEGSNLIIVDDAPSSRDITLEATRDLTIVGNVNFTVNSGRALIAIFEDDDTTEIVNADDSINTNHGNNAPFAYNLKAGEKIYIDYILTGTFNRASVNFRAVATTEHVVTPANSNLARVFAQGNGTGSVGTGTNIDFTEVDDDRSAWNGTQYTVQNSGGKLSISGVAAFTANNNEAIVLYINGVADIRLSGVTGSSTNPFNAELSGLQKGDVLSFRPTGTLTLSNNGAAHHITITEYGDADFLAVVPVQKVAYVKDVKSSGTHAGTFTSGAWRVRDLNTVSGDSEIVTVSSNQFTLSRGEYLIDIDVPAASVNAHKARLLSTDSQVKVVGSSEYATVSELITNDSKIRDKIVLTESKTFEVQHQCESTKATDGFGRAGSFDDEVYTTVKITKLR